MMPLRTTIDNPDRSRSKRRPARYPPSCARSSPASSFGRDWAGASTSTHASWPHGEPSRNEERGFLLVFLLPVLALLALFFLGSLRVAAASQSRVAWRSRLDVCAVRLSVGRERLLTRLAGMNAALELSMAAVYAARAAMLVPGAGQATAVAGEAAALRANRLWAAGQRAAIAAASAAESAALRCPADRFSTAPAICLATPPAAVAFRREPALFPDVAGPLRAMNEAGGLARIHCGGPTAPPTELSIQGDPRLERGSYHDAYVL